MTRLKSATLAVILALSAAPAVAQETPNGGAQAFGTWLCVQASDKALGSMNFAGKGISVNTILLQDGKETVTNAPTLNLSASAQNQSEELAGLSIEVVGLENNAPVFALSAHPEFGALQINQSEVLKTYIFAPQGTAKKADRICVRVNGIATWN